jgi:hypothetical protein
VNIKIAGKWMFIPLKMVLIGIDPYPFVFGTLSGHWIGLRENANDGEYVQDSFPPSFGKPMVSSELKLSQ